MTSRSSKLFVSKRRQSCKVALPGFKVFFFPPGPVRPSVRKLSLKVDQHTDPR
jgi:hypothetical protein